MQLLQHIIMVWPLDFADCSFTWNFIPVSLFTPEAQIITLDYNNNKMRAICRQLLLLFLYMSVCVCFFLLLFLFSAEHQQMHLKWKNCWSCTRNGTMFWCSAICLLQCFIVRKVNLRASCRCTSFKMFNNKRNQQLRTKNKNGTEKQKSFFSSVVEQESKLNLMKKVLFASSIVESRARSRFIRLHSRNSFDGGPLNQTEKHTVIRIKTIQV